VAVHAVAIDAGQFAAVAHHAGAGSLIRPLDGRNLWIVRRGVGVDAKAVRAGKKARRVVPAFTIDGDLIIATGILERCSKSKGEQSRVFHQSADPEGRLATELFRRPVLATGAAGTRNSPLPPLVPGPFSLPGA
jgi:hypothetical protein